MRNSDKSKVADSWDTYWQGTGDIGAFSSGGVSHPAIDAFWTEEFAAIFSAAAGMQLSVADIATGNGAIIERLFAAGDEPRPMLTCIDISAAAIDNVTQRFPDVVGVVADAKSIPLEDAGFDLVCSQFGVEYAGLEAVHEAARLVAEDGVIAMLMHIEHGVVHQECAANHAAVTALQEADFVPLAIDFFKAGFAAVRGADRAPYDEAGRRFSGTIQAVESILQQFGKDVAGETIFRLYNDIGNIHSQLPKYDPSDVIPWLEKMQGELVEYAERMSSMIDSATSERQFTTLCDELSANGFVFTHREPLLPAGTSTPVAWALLGKRQGTSNG